MYRDRRRRSASQWRSGLGYGDHQRTADQQGGENRDGKFPLDSDLGKSGRQVADCPRARLRATSVRPAKHLGHESTRIFYGYFKMNIWNFYFRGSIREDPRESAASSFS